ELLVGADDERDPAAIGDRFDFHVGIGARSVEPLDGVADGRKTQRRAGLEPDQAREIRARYGLGRGLKSDICNRPAFIGVGRREIGGGEGEDGESIKRRDAAQLRFKHICAGKCTCGALVRYRTTAGPLPYLDTSRDRKGAVFGTQSNCEVKVMLALYSF